MTCNSNCYLPLPPRAWSRVQNTCSLFENFQDDPSTTATAIVPYSRKTVPASTLYLEYAMLNKGNVLQYKKNSSSLTKQQRYAQIAKGLWTNRNTTWATQSTRGYTNPNNQSLQRVNNINITLAGVPTTAPLTCPTPITPINDTLPFAGGGGSANPETLPPPPPPPTGNFGTVLPDTVPEPLVSPIVIQDLGNLVCGTQQNVCTGETIRQSTDVICHPTTDSDVPGSIMELCWNDGTPTWYPRQRYVMSNSANKWPVNATLLSAVKPLPPVIISVSNVDNVVTLTWTQDERCVEVTQFIIYEDEIPVKIVTGSIFTTDIIIQDNGFYTFYIIGRNGNVNSVPSNTVSTIINVQSTPPTPPTPTPPTPTPPTPPTPTPPTNYWVNNNNVLDAGYHVYAPKITTTTNASSFQTINQPTNAWVYINNTLTTTYNIVIPSVITDINVVAGTSNTNYWYFTDSNQDTIYTSYSISLISLTSSTS